jgi:hypothetical protein
VGEVEMPAALAMPARRQQLSRVQLNTRVRVELEELLQRFVADHDTTVQSSVDLALVEFLAARGYPMPGDDDPSTSQ